MHLLESDEVATDKFSNAVAWKHLLLTLIFIFLKSHLSPGRLLLHLDTAEIAAHAKIRALFVVCVFCVHVCCCLVRPCHAFHLCCWNNFIHVYFDR